MPLLEDVNRVLRDFERYTGDGRPGEPAAAPLPTGDPSSGVHNPRKHDLRELLKAILQSMGDPSALADLVAVSRRAGVHPLTGVAGTADAITAASIGYAEVAGETMVMVVPTTTNTGPATLALGGGPVRNIVSRNSAPLQAGALRAFAPAMLRLGQDGQWRLITDAPSLAEFASSMAEIGALQSRVAPIENAVQTSEGAGEIIFAVKDEAGNGTFVAARASDGAPTTDAARLIGAALREAGEMSFTRANPDGTWGHPDGGRFARSDADLRQIVGWGSSSPTLSEAAWSAMATSLGAVHVSRAAGGQTNNHVLIQLGAVKPLITGGSLGAAAGSTAAVTVETLAGARAVNLRATTGLLVKDGVQIAGTLRGGSALEFVRATAGTAADLSSGWRFWSDDERLRSRMALIWSPKNDITEGQGIAEVLAEVRRITDYMSPLLPRYLVIGVFPDPGYTAAQVASVVALNDLLAATYGDLFVPVMPALLGTQIFIDLGLTATQADLDARAAGRVPPSLMVDAYHLTPAVYGWITQNLIKPRLTAELGWYQEA